MDALKNICVHICNGCMDVFCSQSIFFIAVFLFYRKFSFFSSFRQFFFSRINFQINILSGEKMIPIFGVEGPFSQFNA